MQQRDDPGGAYLFGCITGLFLELKTFFYLFMDLNRREFLFSCLLFCVLWMGFYPEIFLEPMHTSVANLVQMGSGGDKR